MNVAVLGHVEWVDFVRVARLPEPGAIVPAIEAWEEAAGGGGVAAVELARLAGRSTLYTALGDDERGRRAETELARRGVRVAAGRRREPQRRAITFVESTGERTITVIGRRIAAEATDPLPWDDFAATDAVYVCAGDAAAIRLARRARIVVATARILPVLREAGIVLDAIVGSRRDPAERYEDGDLEPRPRLVVTTDGDRGGDAVLADGRSWRYPVAPLAGPVADAYGAGDSFAAALAFGLAAESTPAAALAVAARSGAAALTRRGAHGRD